MDLNSQMSCQDLRRSLLSHECFHNYDSIKYAGYESKGSPSGSFIIITDSSLGEISELDSPYSPLLHSNFRCRAFQTSKYRGSTSA